MAAASMSHSAGAQKNSVKPMVRDALGGPGKKAYFVTELVAILKRAEVGKEEVEIALRELQAENQLVLRDNFCADPHLAEVDLRVVSLVGSESDGYAKALHEIDLAWSKWLGEFLANHRCG